jgi:hypothetical protein
MAVQDPVKAEKPPGDGEHHAAELAEYLSKCAKELVTAYDDALAGKYDATRLVKDASRLTAHAIGDAAKLIVCGIELAKAAAERPADGTAPTGPPGTVKPPRTAPQAPPPVPGAGGPARSGWRIWRWPSRFVGRAARRLRRPR